MEVQISKIKVGEYQLRDIKDDESMDDLCSSIRRVGVVQPLIVCREADQFVLIGGHRRFKAAVRVGLASVPCTVRDSSEAESREVAFAENMFRKDLSPVETASALKDVLALEGADINEIARGLHRSVDWIRRMVAMCDWPADVLLAVHQGHLSVSAGANVALIEEDTYRDFLLRNATENGATARTTSAWLQAWRSMQPVQQAINNPPVDGGIRTVPMIPQAPCLCCGQVFRMDELSHVPVCVACVKVLRDVRVAGVGE